MAVCQFFITSNGCTFGADCRNSHDLGPVNVVEETTPIQHKRSNNRKRNNQNQSSKPSESTENIHKVSRVIKPGLVLTKVVKPEVVQPEDNKNTQSSKRLPVKKPISKSLEAQLKSTTDPVEQNRLIRDIEVNQITRRFNDCVKQTLSNNDLLLKFSMKPTDPDFPFDLESLTLHLTVPAYYPIDRNCQLQIQNSDIPIKYTNIIQKAFEKKTAASTLPLLKLFDWLDRELEGFLIEKSEASQVKITFHQPDTIIHDRKKYYGGMNSEQSNSDENIESTDEEMIDIDQSVQNMNLETVSNLKSELTEEMDDSESEEDIQTLQPQSVKHQGTQIRFPNISIQNISLLHCSSLSLTVKCSRCKEFCDFLNIKPSTETDKHIQEKTCFKCSTILSVQYRKDYIHTNSISLGYLDLEGCTPFELLPSQYFATCSSCNKEQLPNQNFQNLTQSSTHSKTCQFCHQLMIIGIQQLKFVQLQVNQLQLKRKSVKRVNDKVELGIVLGKPLPNNGVCSHYKRSYRWFRFPCCQKLFACDICHDDKSDHEMVWANKMLCGFCSKEQNYSQKPCSCGKELTRTTSGGFWEGGKGTRNQRLMARNDTRKFAGLTKTMSRKAQDKKFGK
ncbi:hypothetical protein BC833DRAFT_579736 [Globomyces pollinis-pini]|nr:hypothetical protein BC833DRAFT_579736 [Globomyces pollinis-pini]